MKKGQPSPMTTNPATRTIIGDMTAIRTEAATTSNILFPIPPSGVVASARCAGLLKTMNRDRAICSSPRTNKGDSLQALLVVSRFFLFYLTSESAKTFVAFWRFILANALGRDNRIQPRRRRRLSLAKDLWPRYNGVPPQQLIFL
ncbi:hypothetical protein [Rhodoblastus sp.]|uniref:hypothetical protein n=1 Tax=Rhodoblastus sp. TaxID=1962975 RepID=UPI003F977E57